MRTILLLVAALGAGCSTTDSQGGDLGAPADMARSYDFARADLAGADAASPPDLINPAGDLATTADLAALPDLIPPVDLTFVPDLTQIGDMTIVVVDQSMPPDLTAVRDLTVLPDLITPADLSCNPATCVNPPANGCNQNVAVLYPNPGSCDNNGNCTYPPTNMPCTNGCFGGFCTDPFVSIGGTTAAQNGGAIPLDVTTSNGSSTKGGPATHTAPVGVTTKTMPGGTVQSVTLVWSLDPAMALQNQNPVPMTLSSSTLFVDTWSAQIPPQAQGAEVYFFLFAHPYNGADAYDPNGFGIHYAYAVN